MLATRKEGKGLWRQFKSDAPDSALRSNLKVFLAGALEATTSYASWAISHLARNLPRRSRYFRTCSRSRSIRPKAWREQALPSVTFSTKRCD